MTRGIVTDRKPPVSMHSRDNRLTVRLTDDEREEWNSAAASEGEETSRFFRRMAAIGKKMREAQRLVQAAGA